MQEIIVEKPYRFIPPHRGSLWPWFIQQFRLTDRYLRKVEGVDRYQIHGLEHFQDSLRQGHGVLLTPNHCRYADPLVMGWLARAAGTHVFAMASWHLFQKGWFTPWAIRKMGGFSVYREGVDRQSIDTAVDALANATRPLVLFPEGAVFRSNDRVQALLDGVSFIARTAAKRRIKNDPTKKVVVHPVAIKYLFKGDIHAYAEPLLTEIEKRLTWTHTKEPDLLKRISRVGLGLLALKEIEHLKAPQTGTLAERQQRLIDHLLQPIEQQWLGRTQQGAIIPRIKMLRMKILPDMIQGQIDDADRAARWKHLADLYLAQQVASYPPDYLDHPVTKTRILETLERFEEDLKDVSKPPSGMEAIIQVAPAIEVDPERPPKGAEDPLMANIRLSLQSMLDQLAAKAEPYQA